MWAAVFDRGDGVCYIWIVRSSLCGPMMCLKTTIYRLTILAAFLPAVGIAVLAIARDEPEHLPPPVPLEFKGIMERYGDVRMFMTRQEVEALLGPPTERTAWDPEFERIEQAWRNRGRNIFPEDRVWQKWIDPKDASRWVAVLYSVQQNEQKVHNSIKRGF